MYDNRVIRFIMILGIMNGALLTISIWSGAFSVFLNLLTIPLAALCVFIIEKSGSAFGNLLSGWIPGRPDHYAQFSADLQKIKYSKRIGHFDEALSLVNELLYQAPDFPEALFLKAHILWEGFGNAEASKGYLKKIQQLVPEDETLHQWASNYYDEMTSGMEGRQTTKAADENN
jgi:tetratricopeptide (TPR) repeat protein